MSDVLASVALVVSFATALISFLYARRSFKVTNYQGASERALQMDQVFIEYPMLRPYFYDAKAVPVADSELRNRILAVAEFVVDILEDIWDNKDFYAKEEQLAWEGWICDVLGQSPACSDYCAKHIRWYPTLEDLLFPASFSKVERLRRSVRPIRLPEPRGADEVRQAIVDRLGRGP